MTDIVISGGKTITVNVAGLTVKEWRDFTTKRGTIKDENAVVSRCTGIPEKDIEAMEYQDFRRVVQAIVRACQEPLSDPS